MKKIATLFLAFFAVMAVNAELIWHESFDRPLGCVDNGGCANAVYADQPATMPADNYTDWWAFNSNSKKANPTEVVAGSFAWPGYVATPVGGKIELTYGVTTIAGMTGNTFSRRVLRQIEPISSGKVYAAAIIQVDSMTASTTANPILAFGNATSGISGNTWAQLRVGRCSKTSDYYRLTISKYDETSYNDSTQIPNYQKLWSQPLALKTPHLVVFEYEFMDGTKNDICRVYVDPTIETTECDVITQASYTKNGGITAAGANTKNDIPAIKSLNVLPYGTFLDAFIDEIKVATSWEDLFEAGESVLIKSNVSNVTKYVPAGGAFSDSIVIAVENAAEGDVLTVQSQDPNSIILVDDEAFDGIDASDPRLETGLTVHFWSDPEMPVSESGSDVLEIACGSATKEIAVNWVVLPTISSLANVHDSVYYTGNAVVTYNADGIVTLQDASGAIAVNSLTGFAVGDVVTNVMLLSSSIATSGAVTYKCQAAMASDVVIEIVPEIVLLGTLLNNQEQYMHKLVCVEGTSLSELLGGKTFSSMSKTRNEATQDCNTIYVSTPVGNTLVGKTMPKYANVVGVFEVSANYPIVCPRDTNDVIATSSPVSASLELDVSQKSSDTILVNTPYTINVGLKGARLTDDVELIVYVPSGVVGTVAHYDTLYNLVVPAESVIDSFATSFVVTPTKRDHEWRVYVVAESGCMSGRNAKSATISAVVIEPKLVFDSDTVHFLDTMYVGSVYKKRVVLSSQDTILSNQVTLEAMGGTLDSYTFTADSVNGGAEVTITIAPTEANAAWTGSITATCGELTATVTMSGVVATNVSTAVDNLATEVKTVKVIKNGQVRIVRGENEFSVLGEQVK